MANELKKVNVNGFNFLVEDDCDILSAILDAGFTVNHSCRDGRCGECTMNVVNSVSETERLACQYIPSDGDVIEFDTLEEFSLPPAIISPTKIHSIEHINEKFMLIEFRLPPSKKLHFFPGQYVDLEIPHVGTRSYSIYSSDTESQKFKILVGKVYKGSATEFFYEKAKLGTLLMMKGPFGSFFYRKNYSKELIFCATGSGISPIISIVNSNQFRNNMPNLENIYLFWSNSNAADFFELSIGCNVLENIKVKRFVTRVANKDFFHGRILSPVLNLLADEDKNKLLDIYACGHPDFISDLKKNIQKQQLPHVKLYTDPFNLSRPV